MLMSAMDWAKAAGAWVKSVVDRLRGNGGDNIGKALGLAMQSTAQILATSFVTYLQAMGTTFLAIGKLISGAFLEDIMQLPFMSGKRKEMARQAMFGAKPKDTSKHDQQLSVIEGLSMEGQLALATRRGQRDKMLGGAVDDFVSRLPRTGDQFMGNLVEQVRQLVEKIDKLVGDQGGQSGAVIRVDTINVKDEKAKRTLLRSARPSMAVAGT
jgi:hypothetical protein